LPKIECKKLTWSLIDNAVHWGRKAGICTSAVYIKEECVRGMRDKTSSKCKRRRGERERERERKREREREREREATVTYMRG
jgi:hypothetical protein